MMTVVALLASQAHASKLIVNEFFRDTTLGTTGTEWVELVLLQDMTATELNGMFVGDSSSTTVSKFSGYHLQNMSTYASTFYAGTILVIAGGAGPATDSSYDPANN